MPGLIRRFVWPEQTVCRGWYWPTQSMVALEFPPARRTIITRNYGGAVYHRLPFPHLLFVVEYTGLGVFPTRALFMNSLFVYALRGTLRGEPDPIYRLPLSNTYMGGNGSVCFGNAIVPPRWSLRALAHQAVRLYWATAFDNPERPGWWAEQPEFPWVLASYAGTFRDRFHPGARILISNHKEVA